MKKIFIFLLSLNFIMLNANGQTIYTKAGNGGNPGDYLPATSASMAYPTGVAVDVNGNIFIADQTNNRIRKVNAVTGQITTVAGTGIAGYSGDGGAAASAQIRSPWAVAVDGSGNLFIADEFNHRIRKVNAVNGIISTIAGTGSGGFSGDGGLASSAQLNYPNGLTVDAGGNIFIADYFNHRIRKINASDGKINTVAGTGTNNFSGDGGLAVSAQLNSPTDVAVDGSGNIFIADKSNNRIRKVNANDGKINTIAGNGTTAFAGDGGAATAAGLNGPLGVAVDINGNVFIADDGHAAIRKVNGAGIISTVAGTGIFGFSGDGGSATSAQLKSPHQVAVDGNGNIFIDDYYNYRIRKVNAGGIISTVAGNGTVTGAGQTGQAATAQFSNPTGVALDGSGNIYIADFNNSRIHKVNAADGRIMTVAGRGDGGIGSFGGDGGAATVADLSHPTGLTLDINGNIFIADRYNHRIRKVNAGSGIITTVAGNGPDNSGNGGGYSGDGGLATSARLNNPYGVAVDGNGNIYIADDFNHRVRKVTATTGMISTVAGTGTSGYSGDGGLATSANISFPVGVAVDASGNIFIADAGNNRVRKVNITDGTISTVAGTGSAAYSGDGGLATMAALYLPEGITLDGSGNIYISEFGNNSVRKVNAANNIITTVAGLGFRISGFSGDGGTAVNAKLFNPLGLAVDINNNIFIADAGNNRIRYVCANNGLSSSNSADTITAYPENRLTSLGFKNNCSLIATIVPNGSNPVTGVLTGKVWIESSVLTYNNQPYVQRHYEITPQTNASTATAGVTLYFTQPEFSAYNANAQVVNGTYPKLPVDAQDAANNKANLRITKKDGISNDGTGQPGSYTGTTTSITPGNIAWNATSNWWEVNINVSGFSGFFANTSGNALPVTLLSFTAQKQQNDVMTNWETANQLNFSHYEIERSLDATHFEKAGTVQPMNGSGVLNYQFKDLNAVNIYKNNGRLFYRLKMIDRDGTTTYSKIARVDFDKKYTVYVYPNPARDKIYVEGIHHYKYISITDVSGKKVYQQKITQGSETINISNLQKGVYTITLTGNDDVQSFKFLKK